MGFIPVFSFHLVHRYLYNKIVDTLFIIHVVQKLAKLILCDKSQNSGYFWNVFTGRHMRELSKTMEIP